MLLTEICPVTGQLLLEWKYLWKFRSAVGKHLCKLLANAGKVNRLTALPLRGACTAMSASALAVACMSKLGFITCCSCDVDCGKATAATSERTVTGGLGVQMVELP